MVGKARNASRMPVRNDPTFPVGTNGGRRVSEDAQDWIGASKALSATKTKAKVET